jgi:hypothetical protein
MRAKGNDALNSESPVRWERRPMDPLRKGPVFESGEERYRDDVADSLIAEKVSLS